jgi:hypothetical protein
MQVIQLLAPFKPTNRAHPLLSADCESLLFLVSFKPIDQVLRLVGCSVRRARGGVILKSTTNKGGLL